MMRNLVWTFWLALILAIIGTFVSSIILVRQWNSFMHYSQLEGRPNYPLQELSKEIEIVLNNNNKGDLETILLDNPIVEFGEVFLINSSGSDVLGRALPEEIMIDQDDRSLRKQPIFTQKIKSNSGELFSLIFRFDLRTRPVWRLFKRFGLYWVFFATFVVSGLISWWLAAKTVRPIKDIALASAFQKEGDFLAKIDKKILQRPDEIGQLAKQLQKSGLKIQDLIKKQKELLRDVSHEVRTPLSRLLIAAETLELDAGDERALNQIKEEVLIIDQLVQDLLYLSHFDRPSESHKTENFPLSILINKCVERSKMLGNSNNISMEVKDKNWQDLNITGIKFLLDRALDNLISNAVRHSPKNGKIEIRCEIDKKHCCLSVWDEGEGVSEESLEEIFEPFFRIDSSRNRQTGGFGLGLSLVKSIAELHKGSVIASNHPNGFEVKLILPLAK